MRLHRHAKAWLVAAASAALWVITSSAATAVDVKGTVKSAPGAAKRDEPLRPAYWREWNGFLQPTKDKLDVKRDVTVALIGKTGNKDAATVEFRGGDLLPRTIVVQAGAGLRLRNLDDMSHELYAVGLESFGPDETRAGMGRQIALDKAGSWPLRDKLVPHVRGHLHVLDKVTAVAQPNEDGSFTFPDVPEGKYLLKVFYGAEEVASKPLEIPGGGKPFTVDPMLVNPGSKR